MIYVMSDIHGNIRAFNKIMNQIKLSDDDMLIVLGDIIDRGKAGITILQRLMSMKNVKVIMGNHEYLMLTYLKNPNEHNRFLWYRNGGKVTEDAFNKLSKKKQQAIIEYLESLDYYINVAIDDKKYLLAHAAPPYLYKHHWRDFANIEEFIVWHRLGYGDYDFIEDVFIYGHTPTIDWAVIKNKKKTEIHKIQNAICIDCGAAYPDEKEVKTCLACLRLDDMKIFYS